MKLFMEFLSGVNAEYLLLWLLRVNLLGYKRYFVLLKVLLWLYYLSDHYIDGLVQYYSYSIADALESLQFCTKPSIYSSLTDNGTISTIDEFDKIHQYQITTIHTKAQACRLFLEMHWMRVVVSLANHSHRQTSNVSSTKSQNLNISHLAVQLSSPKPLKPGVESRMKM